MTSGQRDFTKVYAQAIVEAADRHECQAEVVEELTHVVEECFLALIVYERSRIASSNDI